MENRGDAGEFGGRRSGPVHHARPGFLERGEDPAGIEERRHFHPVSRTKAGFLRCDTDTGPAVLQVVEPPRHGVGNHPGSDDAMIQLSVGGKLEQRVHSHLGSKKRIRGRFFEDDDILRGMDVHFDTCHLRAQVCRGAKNPGNADACVIQAGTQRFTIELRGNHAKLPVHH